MARYTEYFELNGKFYAREMVWWEAEGYYRPMRAVKISKREYKKATANK